MTLSDKILYGDRTCIHKEDYPYVDAVKVIDIKEVLKEFIDFAETKIDSYESAVELKNKAKEIFGDRLVK